MQITPYEEANRVSNFSFKEPEGKRPNTAWSSLVKGIGDVFGDGVKAFDTATKLTIDDQVSSDVNYLRKQNIGENKELVGNLLAATQSPTEAPTALTANAAVDAPGGAQNAPASSTEAPKAIPAQIGIGLRDMDKINQANNQGQFDNERFYGEIQARTANLVTRYPGYADYIQQKVTHFLGTDPANAQREALQNTLRQLLGTGKDQKDNWEKEVLSYGKDLGLGGAWVTAAMQANDPVSRATFRAQAADRQSIEKGIDRSLKDLQLRTANQQATSVDYVHHATQRLDQDFANAHDNTMMHALNFTGKRADMLAEIARQSREGQPDPEKNQQMALAYGQLESAFSAHFDAEMMKPQFNMVVGPVKDFGRYQDSYSTMIKDPSKIAALKKTYMEQFNDIKTQLGAGLVPLATTMATLVTQQNDSTTAALYRNQGMRTIAASAKMLGPGFNTIYADSNIQNSWKQQNELGRFLLEVSTGKTLAAGAADQNTLKKQFDVYKASAVEKRLLDTDPPPEYLASTIDTLKTILTHPDKTVTLSQRVNAAEVISHPLTTDFFGEMRAQHQPMAFSRLFAPDVTDYIKTHMADTVWSRYRDTVERSFVQLSNTYMADINKIAAEDRGITFKFDPKTQQLEAFNRNGKNLNTFVQPATDPSVVVKDKVNLLLKPLANVLKAEGKEMTPEYLSSIGLNLNGPPTPNATVKSLFDSLKKIPVPEETGPSKAPSGETKGNAVNDPEVRSPSKNPGFSYMSEKEILQHSERPLMLDRKLIIDPVEKRNILGNVEIDKKGNHWLIQDDKMHPVSL